MNNQTNAAMQNNLQKQMVIQKEDLLKAVMAADFTVEDMSLYLDTHPDDRQALNIFCQLVQKAKLLRCHYERMYGPLTVTSSCGYPWPWNKNPWPWEWQ